MKRTYQVPSIKVVSFQVEEGFQGSGDYKIGMQTPANDTQRGTQRFVKEAWYQDPSSSSSEG